MPLRRYGYVRVHMPGHPAAVQGNVLQHRVVMEAYLGRYLTRSEDVHHINGNRADNRIENLELISHGQHSRITNTGRKIIVSETQRKKQSQAMKGKVPWNKAKRGIYSEETLRNMSLNRSGREPWNKGKKHSDESRRKMSEAAKSRRGVKA